ncbi:MAG: AMP-binding protein [Propionibacteriaceae bacterium]|nr:AMP-binding protein [Propionibacteriaceae bacterium]
MTALDRPWLAVYGDYPADGVTPDLTLYELLAQSAARWPSAPAVKFLGRTITYAELLADVDRAAAAFRSAGVGPGQTVTLVLPNIPNAIVLLYAVNQVGARVALAHPLSSPTELRHYLNETGSTWAVTVDMFYGQVQPILDETPVERLLVVQISDYLTHPKKLGFRVTKGRKIAPVPRSDRRLVRWREFLKSGDQAQRARRAARPGPYHRPIEPGAGAVVLFSGGTTDLPKGIELSSASFNALGVAMGAITGFSAGHSVLAILPLFHGFGLGLCVHTAFAVGAHAILVPEFSADVYIDNLVKYQPSFIAGVPTLWEALLRHPRFAKVSFAQLVGAYSGGDSLTPDLKARFDAVLQRQGATCELVEGYGLTECVTACVASPAGHYRTGSMGVPIPGCLVKVVAPGTTDEVPFDTEGELCVTGPTLMLGYVGDPEATAATLRRHADGRVWLHTGDLGTMDADGYLYFLGRLKRLIKVSGVSVYPLQVEQVLESHPAVARACVIGIPDDYQVSRLKAFVVLEPGVPAEETTRSAILAHCRRHLIKWAVPKAIEFRPDLPKTLVGKIAYTELEREENAA